MTRTRHSLQITRFLSDDHGRAPIGTLDRFGKSQSVWNLQTRRASVERSNSSGSSSSLAELTKGGVIRKLQRKSKTPVEGLRFSLPPCLSGDIDAVDSKGRSLLFYAVRYGQEDPTRLLLQAGCFINQQDNQGLTPLHEAIAIGHLDMAAILLLEGEADTNVANNSGETPIHLAICRGSIEAVRLLHRFGADINKCDSSGNSPLCSALTKGWSEIVEFLLDKQCDITKTSSNGETCLFLSTQCAKIQPCHIAKRLLKTDYDFRQDSEWLGGEGCPQCIQANPKLYNKLLERAGLKTKSRKGSVLSSGKRKLFKSIRKLSS